MKLRIELEVDERDLDAVAFACSLTPKEGMCRRLQGQVNAQCLIHTRMLDEGRHIIRNARQIKDAHEKLTQKKGA